jgi:imidazolonepropionase-like amidohydrolase
VRCWFLAAALVLAAFPAAAQEAERPPAQEVPLVLHCGSLLVVPGEAPLDKATLVVRGGRIAEVRSGFVPPAELESLAGLEARLIDLSGQFVMPGLIDSHTHMTAENGADRSQRAREGDAGAALRGVHNARLTLEAGFTTVRDLGSSGRAAFALRDAIREGRIPGPRILVAGEPITPTGGHADETPDFRGDPFGPAVPGEGIADGPDACRRAVRAQVKRGADLVKLTASGGVLSDTALEGEQFFGDELAAIVETARLLGRRVAAHAHGARGINAALRAGVDSIEHGTFLDDTSLELFRSSGAFLVPTMTAAHSVQERARVPGLFPPPVVEKALQVGNRIQSAVSRARGAGVRIALGTDAGVAPHGENARELGYLVEAGMTPEQAVIAATVNAAELLGLGDRIGTLERGRAADVIATAGNPLADVAELRRPTFVMRGGVVYRGR